MSYLPIYIQTYKDGRLREKIKQAYCLLRNCTLCPRKCGVNRLNNEKGICKTGRNAIVSSYNAHFGEEAPLVGRHGSGTIFFTNCNLLCIFCQNYEISHDGNGYEISDNELARMMLELQDRGCHNINFVSPSHVIPQILSALEIAIETGLSIPIIYNSGGYDSVETLKILNGVFDIYMPDFKFWDSKIAELTCNASDYPDVVQKAISEMYQQVGDFIIDNTGIAKRGLLVRHLVLPNNLANTKAIAEFISIKISKNTYINVMSQYYPYGRAYEIKGLSNYLSRKEFEKALIAVRKAGLSRLDL